MLPRLLLIADRFASGRPELDAAAIQDRVVALVGAGVRWVSLRDPGAGEATFAEAAARLAERVRQSSSDVLVSVHGRLDVARDLGAGFHAGAHGAGVEEAVAAAVAVGVGPVGFSAHSATQAVRAARAGADYVTFSPVFRTRSHPDAAPAGIDPLRRCAERAGVPVLALGGITPSRARICRMVGAHGAAAISGLLFAWDPQQTVPLFLRRLA